MPGSFGKVVDQIPQTPQTSHRGVVVKLYCTCMDVRTKGACMEKSWYAGEYAALGAEELHQLIARHARCCGHQR